MGTTVRAGKPQAPIYSLTPKNDLFAFYYDYHKVGFALPPKLIWCQVSAFNCRCAKVPGSNCVVPIVIAVMETRRPYFVMVPILQYARNIARKRHQLRRFKARDPPECQFLTR